MSNQDLLEVLGNNPNGWFVNNVRLESMHDCDFVRPMPTITIDLKVEDFEQLSQIADLVRGSGLKASHVPRGYAEGNYVEDFGEDA